ncbi:PD40 domain-containing protein [Caulobacter sp. 17J65-9]|uniref:TolB family protein n=1 Tax=Caulobacter sp. 17J65-9 TaxID=2709382 RepID=UPI0013CB67FD|nr:PD40 domain-containing protein [Caulobacter sp. 17J65-9]NEX95167.1 hypothetical protein [Caulobacter sp. 17J65-9]
MGFRVGRRAFVLGAAAAGLAGCDRTPAMPENFATPWREETGQAARYFSQYTHDLNDGVALSPDGGLFAATLYGAPVNELALIDPKARTTQVLADGDRRLRLAQPAFSPDGKSLVVVRAAPPTFTGRAELVIVDLATGQGRRIGERLSYAWPTFAPDGKSLVYWGDTKQPPPRSRMQPEYREFVDFALFRLDLASGAETRLDPRTFVAPSQVAALADGRVLFTAIYETTDGVLLPPTVECENRLLGARVLAAAQEPPKGCAVSAINAHDPLLDGAKLRGAARDGRLLLENGRAEPAVQSFAVIWDGTTATFVAPPPPGVQEPAVNLDGSTVAGVMYDVLDPKGARTLKARIFVQDLATGAQAVFDPPAPSARLTLTAPTGL